MSTGSSSSSSSSARVSIPTNVRKTIHDIREITKKFHGDDEIYAVLKECSMDPNETIQKLMYLDTFHEVKRRRDRRKESHNNGKAAEERPQMGGGVQRRGSRGGGHGNYGSNFSSDAGARRNGGRRENGGMPFLHRPRNNTLARSPRASSAALPNGTAALPNGHASVYLADSEAQSVNELAKVGLASTEQGLTEKEKSDGSLTLAGLNSAPDSLSAPSLLGPYSGVATKVEVGIQKSVAETEHFDETEAVFEDHNVVVSGQAETDEVVVNEAEEESLEGEKIPSKPFTPESPKTVALSSSEVVPEVTTITARVGSLSMNGSNVSYGQHVTFPNHFQVPEALKTGLTFGSFDVSFVRKGELINANIENGVVEKTSQEDNDETIEESTPISDQNVAVSVVEGGYLDNSQQFSNLQKVEQPKQEVQFLHDGSQNHIFSVPSYLGLMSPMVGSQLMPYEGLETQGHDARIPIYANGNAMVIPPTTNPSPPLPTSIAVSPQTVPVYRQTYPPNFFPYGQYISPYYIPQMHQYMGHNGFAPQPTAGGVYIPQPAPPGGIKFSLPQFKPGTTAPNPTHVAVQPVGSFIYPQQVSSGGSVGNDEMVASQLKESQIYTTGQLTEGTGVWLHAGPGQEMPTYPMNSMYSLAAAPPPHHHHQPHIAYATMFPPGPTMAAPSALLQPPAVAPVPGGPIEAVGPLPPAQAGPTYQQQPQQMSWNNTAAF